MPRKPIETILQLYGTPRSFWAATCKAIRLIKESGGAGLLEAAKQKFARPNLPIGILRTDSGMRLTFEERWVLRGTGLTRVHCTSIIMLTKGNQPLVDACLTSLARSILPDAQLEVLIVNNGGRVVLPAAYPFPIRILCEGRPFNWSAYNNRAAQQARGKFLLFLNDDVEALHGGWLDAMLDEATHPDAGAIGAKLLYPTGLIQHYGIIVDAQGDVTLVDRFRQRDHDAVDGNLIKPNEVTAVTGACLLTAKAVWQKSLFDESFALSYNDVDYCLRLRAAGKRIIVTPYAELVHRETTTRPLAIPRHEEQLFARKWARTTTALRQ